MSFDFFLSIEHTRTFITIIDIRIHRTRHPNEQENPKRQREAGTPRRPLTAPQLVLQDPAMPVLPRARESLRLAIRVLGFCVVCRSSETQRLYPGHALEVCRHFWGNF